MKEEKTTLLVQVQPNASQNKLVRLEDGVLHLKIAAPPVKGKANKELCKFLGDILGIGQSNITIVKGMTSKRKVIAIEGLTQGQLTEQFLKI